MQPPELLRSRARVSGLDRPGAASLPLPARRAASGSRQSVRASPSRRCRPPEGEDGRPDGAARRFPLPARVRGDIEPSHGQEPLPGRLAVPARAVAELPRRCHRKQAEAKLVYGYDHARHYEPRIVVLDYQDDPKEPRIEFLDNGVGMSQRVVEQFFLRVGKSYYKSPEFETERARYQEAGIQLDVCSQFGIGILSCFIVANRLRVETYQHGQEPLRLAVDGPSKYFVIRRLCRQAQQPFDRQPTKPEDDGPPERTGTRVVVALKEGTRLDLLEVLQRFAVNLDTPVWILDGSAGDPKRLSRRQWDGAPPTLRKFVEGTQRYGENPTSFSTSCKPWFNRGSETGASNSRECPSSPAFSSQCRSCRAVRPGRMWRRGFSHF